jgi:predicted metal-binding protein
MQRREHSALIDKARSLGAVEAVVMSASDVVVDERVRLKCQIPRCANYSRNLMCPPNVPSLDEFRRALARYHHAILLQFPIGTTEKEVKGKLKGKKLEKLAGQEAYRQLMRDSMKSMLESLAALEKEALYGGYYLALALSGGTCALCDECAGPGGACRHPFMSRPSMEAMGIDVVGTARNAGLVVEFPPKEPRWVCILLVD